MLRVKNHQPKQFDLDPVEMEKNYLRYRIAAAGSPDPVIRSLPTNLEHRDGIQAEIRAEESGDKKVLRGYAARFGTMSQPIAGMFREILDPACFDDCLKSDPDIMMFHSHDPAQILARVSAKTLEVSTNRQGLKFRANLPNTSLGNDVFENVKNGNIFGMSFGMLVNDDDWEDILDPDDDERTQLRTVRSARLIEVSTTPIPAYPSTTVMTASRSIPASMEVRSNLPISVEERIERLKLRLRAASIKVY